MTRGYGSSRFTGKAGGGEWGRTWQQVRRSTVGALQPLRRAVRLQGPRR